MKPFSRLQVQFRVKVSHDSTIHEFFCSGPIGCDAETEAAVAEVKKLPIRLVLAGRIDRVTMRLEIDYQDVSVHFTSADS